MKKHSGFCEQSRKDSSVPCTCGAVEQAVDQERKTRSSERGLIERQIRRRFEQHGNLARVDNILESYEEALVRRCAEIAWQWYCQAPDGSPQNGHPARVRFGG